jgi:hypothetical protein
MLEVVQPSVKLPKTHVEVVASGLLNQSGARNCFWQYRRMIDPHIVPGWWQEHAAWELQWFFEDIEAGKQAAQVGIAGTTAARQESHGDGLRHLGSRKKP